MEKILEYLTEYGILGLWCAYMIYRDIRNCQRIRQIQEAHEIERARFYQDIKDKLNSLGADAKNHIGYKTFYDGMDRLDKK